nr:DUF6056 family protein [uncultured Acetatifactor sp.]
MKKMLEKLYTRKSLALSCLILLIISLFPLFCISRYNHPTGDDIYYSVDTHLIWEATHSIPQVIYSALQGVLYDYQTWQGTYAAMFFMRLQPTAFSEKLYFISPFLVIGLLLWGNGYLLRQVSRYIIPFGRYEQIGLWSVLMFLSLQWVISPAEAFYWFNGSMYYSGFYGLTMLLFGLVCKYVNTRDRFVLVKIFFLEFLIGGSNYLTLLWAMLVLLLAATYLWFKRKPGRVSMTCAAAFLIICFIGSAMAPGNMVRQATAVKMTVLKTILFSLRQGTSYLAAWLNGWWLAGAMVLLIFILPAIRKMSFRFQYPFLVIGFLYGMFCTLSCPTFYAQSNTGPARAVNIIYYGFILTSYIAFFYLAGWIYRKFQTVFSMNDCGNRIQGPVIHSTYGYLLILAIVLQLCIGFNDDTVKQASSIRALADLVSGTAAAYDREYYDRLKLFESVGEGDVILPPYQYRPQTIYAGDYGQDPTQGSNQALAEWYGLRSVFVDYSVSSE